MSLSWYSTGYQHGAALRPYVSAGLAVTGAGLIAVVPVGAPALDIETRAVQLALVEDVANDLASPTLLPTPAAG